MTKIEAKDQIEKLTERFDYHLHEYKVGKYNETQTRNDYINPLFEALGWDIYNKSGYAESYREVIHEDKIKVADSTKAPDYCFTIYGQRKFFLEAKKPSVSVKDAVDPAYQLRRYGWSAKMPISIISDFEEFAIYDCTIKPAPTDKASVSRIKYFTYKEYLKEFDFIWDTFSKEMVLKGSFDKFISSNKGKKGTTGVDSEFLKSLDSWRDLLARNIVNRNVNITEDELNYALQKIIDRIIFLRICEDRGVELENQLMNTIGNNTYNKLKELFHTADLKYNSGLFDYKKDMITDNLIIEDKVLKSIIEEMYYPKSPYEFSVIPVEILGHSYEQYLGKVIKITSGHRIKIEEKPEVRKAGGVYYTPQYIVDYIVKNTFGKLVEGKTPEDVAKLKICDPACGSGSFLLGAYQFLLDWHRNYYLNETATHRFSDVQEKNRNVSDVQEKNRNVSDVQEKNKNVSDVQEKNRNVSDVQGKTQKFSSGHNPKLTPDGSLTTKLKKEILLNNIFGVDIDTNAVEVTKLSLMLKAMEGETEASINQLSFLHERVLPTLDSNIKSGNSLIDIDFYDNQIDFEPGAEKKIKPFNWDSAFPEVFKDKIIEENLQAFHITWATHNSRVSERMIRTHAKMGEPVWLTDEMRSLVVEALEEKILELNLRILALNVLCDHVHLLIVTNPDELSEIVRKLKGYSSYHVCRELKLTVAGEGSTNKFWASGYSDTKIKDENHLFETINYIKNNNIKHGVEECNRRLQPSALTPLSDAFKPKVIKGGFDAVIGNPPYIRLQTMTEYLPKPVIDYYKTNYVAGQGGNIDIYVVFIEKGYNLLNQKGLLGFIQPHKFFQSDFGTSLRDYLSERKAIDRIIHFGAKQIFDNATTYTCLLFLNKFQNNEFDFLQVNEPKEWSSNEIAYPTFKVKQPLVGAKWNFTDNRKQSLLDKLNEMPVKLKDITRKIFQGIATSSDKIYILKIIEEKESSYRCFSVSLDKEIEIEKGLVKPFLMGKDVKRYENMRPKNVVIFPYQISTGKGILMDKKYIQDNFPMGWEYISLNKEALENRERGRMKVDGFYAYIYPKNQVEFQHIKLLMPDITNKPEFTFDSNQLYFTTTIHGISFNDKAKENKYFYLGLLNSKLNWLFVSSTGTILRGGYTRFHKQYVENFPIPQNPAPETQNQLIKLVETMLQLNKDLQTATLPEQKEQLQARIKYTDKQIDQLVYQLYDLTEDEIKIVEGE